MRGRRVNADINMMIRMTNGHKPLFVFEDEDDHSSKKAVAQKAPEASPGRNVRPSVGLAIQQLPVMHFVAYNCCTVVMHFVAIQLPMMHFVA